MLMSKIIIMDIPSMTNGIIKMIDKNCRVKYVNECLDVIQIKNICKLYDTREQAIKDVSLSEIDISSPEFEKMDKKYKKMQIENILKSNRFVKKYSFFIKIIYSSLKLDVNIFNIKDDVVTLKNNYQLIKSLERKKKQIIMEHISILKMHHKKISQIMGPEYEKYCENCIAKIKIIDRIISLLNKLIHHEVLKNTDNLLTLILPYFYVYTDFIEEYN